MQSQKNYKRIVVKLGSSLFYSDRDKLDLSLVREFAGQISTLMQEGKDVAVVSSGAIALGAAALKLGDRPRELAHLQAAAAVGQHELMDAYRRFFKERGLSCAQLLLTWDDFSQRKRYLNAKNTLNALLKLKAVPVINENDTVSTEEIKFGDNDRLSALASILVGADLLVILSDVDGLLDKEKNVIRLVARITPQIKELACPTGRKACVGGMVAKIEAAGIAAGAGIPCVIANGRSKDIILQLAHDSASCGTLFIPEGVRLDAKQRWIAFGTKPKASIIVDDGAKKALGNKKSLLAVGVIHCEGSFSRDDIVSICDRNKVEFARGKAGVALKELEQAIGRRFEREVIHRDNIVIL